MWSSRTVAEAGTVAAGSLLCTHTSIQRICAQTLILGKVPGAQGTGSQVNETDGKGKMKEIITKCAEGSGKKKQRASPVD